ncbi:hypothetical protein F0562_013784 [Nyssa sinensis]|uniref:MADS-box domain-containing protein n=1 Tax=Nyssa sinensis TaxID=561372 RepID=A0A5J4ZPC7_9ASTE|nr:hypothetical protein F0562_013784 [Nyssa sinensis]
MESKQTKGRQRIDMKKRENEEDRLITFSKRRAGIYKKASELCTLCGTDVGLIIFSPSGKPFSFAHPSIDFIANRFLHQNPHPIGNTSRIFEAHLRARIDELNTKLNKQTEESEAEKERQGMLDSMAEAAASENKGWWEAPIDEFGKDEVEKLTAWFQETQGFLSAIRTYMAKAVSAENFTLGVRIHFALSFMFW